MRVSYREWNDFVDRIFRSRLLSVYSGHGQRWRHPWFTQVRWDPLLESHTAHVKPGFCASGEPVKTVDVTAIGIGGMEVRLSQDPDLPIKPETWRAIGTDSMSFNSGTEPVPEYFRQRGVLDSPVLARGQTAALESSPSNARLLRACEVVLYHDRRQTTTTWTERANEAQFGVSILTPPNTRPEAYLRIRRSYTPPAEVDVVTKLLGGWTGDTFDGIHIATLYLMSPPGHPHGSMPDSERWQGYAKHHVFWNLRYWETAADLPDGPDTLAIPAPGLGGGMLGAVGVPLLDIINQETAALEMLLGTREATGHFFSV